MVRHGAVTAAEALTYANEPARLGTISGMESVDVLHQNLEVARGFHPMSDRDMQRLRDRCKADAADGQFELLQTTKKYEWGRGPPHGAGVAGLGRAS
jgi:uncharacterized protein